MYTWACKSFQHLTVEELYKLLQLRSRVFIIEQNCIYLDADDKDQASHHLLGWHENQLIAYARIIPIGISYPDAASIGRVVTCPLFRRKGLGKLLMKKSIEQTHHLFAADCIKIGAQLYLKKFYMHLGFHASSNVYVEDGIEHIEMIYRIAQ